MNEVMNISGVDCYEKEGIVYLKLENVARGLGFTHPEVKNGKEYETIRWGAIRKHLKDMGFASELAKDGFIPENIFYRLAMKAKNKTAESFQALVADEIIPSIRKTGQYAVALSPEKREEMLAKALLIADKTIEENKRQIEMLESKNIALGEKAEYYEFFVEANHNLGLRETAAELGIPEKQFMNFLAKRNFIYRDGLNRPRPYQTAIEDGLLVLKDFKYLDSHTARVMVTPKGKNKFRKMLDLVAYKR